MAFSLPIIIFGTLALTAGLVAVLWLMSYLIGLQAERDQRHLEFLEKERTLPSGKTWSQAVSEKPITELERAEMRAKPGVTVMLIFAGLGIASAMQMGRLWYALAACAIYGIFALGFYKKNRVVATVSVVFVAIDALIIAHHQSYLRAFLRMSIVPFLLPALLNVYRFRKLEREAATASRI